MGQGERRSCFLFALDFGKEIHSVFNEVMLGQNFMLAKSLCFIYTFLPFSIFCLFVFVWVFFLLLHCLILFLLCTVRFLYLENILLHSRFLFGIYALFSPFFLLRIECIIFTYSTAEESPFSPFRGFFLLGDAHLPHFW